MSKVEDTTSHPIESDATKEPTSIFIINEIILLLFFHLYYISFIYLLTLQDLFLIIQ